MITTSNFKELLETLGFEKTRNIYAKSFDTKGAFLKIDFDKKELIYPENRGFKINSRQTCNFDQNENFVVFECVHRLFEKGYKPEHIELEPKWKVGRGASGGRADILVRNQQDKPLLLIECKTWGREFRKAWNETEDDGGQLFSYAQQISQTEFLCLYASTFDTKAKEVQIQQRIISHKDNPEILNQQLGDRKLKAFKDAANVKQRYQVWKETYQLEHTESGIFENSIQPYQIGKDKYTWKEDTNPITQADKDGKYHEFRTILRKHNIARRETAFEVLVNLFLCKLVDEKENKDDLSFYWKGIAYDNYFDFVDRLQELYKIGMDDFLKEEITYISNKQIEEAFWTVKSGRNATKKTIQDYFKKLKFFSNNAFSFINIHNEDLFNRNAKVLVEVVGMWQNLRLRTEEQNQFLGDMFEFFLDNSIKQSEGQFFTPLPICKFIVSSLPLDNMVANSKEPLKAIDYACGSGHFLNEYGHQIKPIVKKHKKTDVREYHKQIIGIEKEDRLAKVAKVSAHMHGQGDIQIFDKDALAEVIEIKAASFDVLVANPPFAVEGFLRTLREERQEKYTLTEITGLNSNTNNIQCFFIERAKQLVAKGGVTGIVVPSSILSNSDSVYIRTREIILEYFDIISIVELGGSTFGKTGTNTIVLFLRRKIDNPEPAEHFKNRVLDFFDGVEDGDIALAEHQDLYLIKKYCEHIEVDFDAYINLLNVQKLGYNGLAELLKFEIFKDYKTDFDKSSEYKKINDRYAKAIKGLAKKIERELKKEYAKKKESITAKALKEAAQLAISEREKQLVDERKTVLEKTFIKYLQVIERDKLYYFILAYENLQKVLIVKTPISKTDQKKLLGYEWSGAKGNEGIKYLGGEILDDIITPMFDPHNPENPDKIAYYIKQNFIGNTFNELPEYCSYTSVADILDFSRKDFNKNFSLSSRKNIKIDTKWDLVALSKITEIQSGGTPSRNKNEYWDKGTIPWLKSEVCKGNRVETVNEYITEEGLKNSSAKYFNPNSTLVALVGATKGKTAFLPFKATTNQNIAGLYPVDLSKLHPQYLFYICTSMYRILIHNLSQYDILNLTRINSPCRKNCKI